MYFSNTNTNTITKNIADKVERYRFDDKILKEINGYLKLDNWHGFAQVFEDWIIIVVAVLVSEWVWQKFPPVIGCMIYSITIFIIGARMRALIDLLHQSVHKTLAKNKVINFILGTFLSSYLVLQSYSGYQKSHIILHHGHFGDFQLDPDYIELQKNGLYGSNLSTKTARHYLLRIIHPTTTLTYLQYILKNRISQEELREKVIRLIYLIVLNSIFIYVGLGEVLLFYWYVPLLTTSVWIGALIEFFEHYPLMEVTPKGFENKIDIFMSRNRIGFPLTNFWLGIHGEGYHLLHHLFPAIPSWNYKAVNKILMKDKVYASRNQNSGWSNFLNEYLA